MSKFDGLVRAFTFVLVVAVVGGFMWAGKPAEALIAFIFAAAPSFLPREWFDRSAKAPPDPPTPPK
jgi:hypothetical protein